MGIVLSKKIIGHFVILLLLLLCLIGVGNKHEVYAYDSLMAFENNTQIFAVQYNVGDGWFAKALKSVVSVGINCIKLTIHCLSTSRLPTRIDYGNNCIPDYLLPDVTNPCGSPETFSFYDISSDGTWDFIAELSRIILMLIGGNPYAIFKALTYIPIFYACITHYALTASEAIMLGITTDKGSGKFTADAEIEYTMFQRTYNIKRDENYISPSAVPFFYSCKFPGGYDGINNGYVGKMSTYCDPQNRNVRGGGHVEDYRDLVHKIIIGTRGFSSTIFDTSTKSKSNIYDTFFMIKAGEKAYAVHAFFRYYGGKIRLCAAKSVFGTRVVLGCVAVPPPLESKEEHEGRILKACDYILEGLPRSDLYQVAESVFPSNEKLYQPVYHFLKSDWHIMSTIYECFQQMLIESMIGGSNVRYPFMMTIQNGVKDLVFVILSIYVCILAIRIISLSGPNKMSDYAMIVIKISVVIYVSIGSVWFDPNQDYSDGHDADGLYPALLRIGEDFMDMFLEAKERNTPVKMCYYPFAGENILSSRTFTVNDNDGNTIKIRMSVWDYLDCLFANYMTFNSCSYTTSSMIPVLFISTGLWSGLTGFMISIMMLVYCICFLAVIFKFFHIALLSLFAITILVVVSPIMVCFVLFDTTKNMTSSWFKSLIGYLLYPGLLFAFLVLMLSVFDSIFYDIGAGDQHYIDAAMEESLKSEPSGVSENVEKWCEKRDSVFCVMYETLHFERVTGCGRSNDAIPTYFYVEVVILLLGVLVNLSSSALTLFVPLMKMFLFTILFYLMMDSVVGFISSLLSIAGMEDKAYAGKIGDKMAVGLAKGKAGSYLGKAIGKDKKDKKGKDEDKGINASISGGGNRPDIGGSTGGNDGGSGGGSGGGGDGDNPGGGSNDGKDGSSDNGNRKIHFNISTPKGSKNDKSSGSAPNGGSNNESGSNKNKSDEKKAESGNRIINFDVSTPDNLKANKLNDNSNENKSNSESKSEKENTESNTNDTNNTKNDTDNKAIDRDQPKATSLDKEKGGTGIKDSSASTNKNKSSNNKAASKGKDAKATDQGKSDNTASKDKGVKPSNVKTDASSNKNTGSNNQSEKRTNIPNQGKQDNQIQKNEKND